jgi:hypothetical protein
MQGISLVISGGHRLHYEDQVSQEHHRVTWSNDAARLGHNLVIDPDTSARPYILDRTDTSLIPESHMHSGQGDKGNGKLGTLRVTTHRDRAPFWDLKGPLAVLTAEVHRAR